MSVHKYGAIIYIFLPLAFSMATDLATDLEYQLIISCKCYEAAHDLLTSGVLKELGQEQLGQVLKRLGNIRNEMGVFYMNQAAAMQTEKEGGEMLIQVGSLKVVCGDRI